MSIVEGLVKRRALPAARMPAAFTQLGRNVEWWTAHGPPGSSAATGGLPRVTFPGDPIVLQWYPGQGLAIQWLATFGKANALAAAGKTDELRLLLDRATALAGRRGTGWVAWEYLLAFGGGRAPWVSGIAQGTGIQAFTRGAQLLGNPAYLETARSALGAFEAAPPTGIAIDADGGRHYLLYSFAPRMKVLNAFLQSLVGVLDFANVTGDPRARAVYNLGRHRGAARAAPVRHRRLVAVRAGRRGVDAELPRARHGLPGLAVRPDREPRLLRDADALHDVPAPAAARDDLLRRPAPRPADDDRAGHALEGLHRRTAHPAREPRDRRPGRHPAPRDAHVQARSRAAAARLPSASRPATSRATPPPRPARCGSQRSLSCA